MWTVGLFFCCKTYTLKPLKMWNILKNALINFLDRIGCRTAYLVGRPFNFWYCHSVLSKGFIPTCNVGCFMSLILHSEQSRLYFRQWRICIKGCNVQGGSSDPLQLHLSTSSWAAWTKFISVSFVLQSLWCLPSPHSRGFLACHTCLICGWFACWCVHFSKKICFRCCKLSGLCIFAYCIFEGRFKDFSGTELCSWWFKINYNGYRLSEHISMSMNFAFWLQQNIVIALSCSTGIKNACWNAKWHI